jgi:hypothetical protein
MLTYAKLQKVILGDCFMHIKADAMTFYFTEVCFLVYLTFEKIYELLGKV